MSNALHDYAKLFEKYAAANGGWGVILAGEDCLSLANEMMIDADALEAENAKLSELDADLWEAFRLGGPWVAHSEYMRVKAENAKLRELVRILAYCMSEDRDCDRCALNGADMPTPRISACDSLPDLMRELGVEVDE